MDNKQPVYTKVSTYEQMLKAHFVRGIVFVGEQDCPYLLEFDGNDLACIHFLVTVDGDPAGTARIRMKEAGMKIERIAVRKEYRGMGMGRGLVRYVLDYISTLPCGKVVIHAQSHLKDFYEGLGFRAVGEPFPEAGIEHIYMELHTRN